MTIDEAIKKYRKLSNSDRTCYPEEAAQIAEWLEELKVYKEKEFDVLKQDGQLLYKQGVIDGYDKAIDDFVEKLKSDEFQKYKLDMVFETSRDLTYSQCVNAFHEYIDEITKQLKKGRVDD